ncbi:23S rRNA (adenine(2503)-C(2))-methyltransferase RlmN [Herbivorax sp. ANBcel31]|uniref:23S rRNA (adenine(2503)-C(2))-methyltransferase RlmN n=1 Tax=Herbivorax sp. ANBcel31 TaxID=3069754 RepID=UPI0027B520C0|nr:23S rRNA (adenine(2503)-C(2))-methyltransferase RlmN [Herbivorax sp. ANBcel31]MDQ2087155.1 23S rRNA (adenine(2503)-C(2))-methyltransferase RlmN [Herbivorax sp. ANBcel31]
MEGKVDLLNMEINELQDFLVDLGEKKFRARQIFEWLNKGVKDIDDMTNLSKVLREKLKFKAYINNFEVVKKLISQVDGTRKYIFKLYDRDVIESVLMNYSHGFSVCISSQVGCRMGCSFCASTGAGFNRNLSASEMLDQVLTIGSDIKKRIGNVVIMGIGEPLDNYDNLIKFLRLINHKDGLNIGLRHIAISTCGLVPEILRFSKENMPVTLSISLHAPDDETRGKIMPINNKYPLDKLIEACKIYTMTTSRRITFEYSLIDGVNDSLEHAKKLALLIKGMLCHVNLIPVNTVSSTDYKKSSREKIQMFRNVVQRHGIEVTVRRELGSEIDAACGQLRRNIKNNI